MRVLFAVSAWPGHYFPMIPLGWALRAAGHEVRVLCNESDVDPLIRAGMTPVPVLDGLESLRGARMVNLLSAYQGTWPFSTPPLHPDTAEPVDLATFDFGSWHADIRDSLLERATRSADAAVAYARSWQPDLVVHDLQSLEGPLVAKVTDVPDVLHLWGPVGTDDPYSPVDSGGTGGRSSMPKDLSAAFARHGAGEMSYELIDHVLDPCPESIRPATKGKRHSIRFIPYNGPGSAPLDVPVPTDKQRVCVVWGRSATRTFGATVNKMPDVVEAAVALDTEVLLLASPGDVADLGPLPDSVHLMVDVPLNMVLSDCDAVVHYGGGGVAMTSMVAGVPQLVLPCGYDQPQIARRIADAGAGLDIPNHEADSTNIKAALDRLLTDPRFASSAQDLAVSSSALPTPADTVAVLEGLCTNRS